MRSAKGGRKSGEQRRDIKWNEEQEKYGRREREIWAVEKTSGFFKSLQTKSSPLPTVPIQLTGNIGLNSSISE